MADRPTASSITDDQLEELYAERDQLLAELDGRDEAARERWIAKQLAETGLKAMDFRNGMAMELEPARDMVAHWVGAARAMLGDAPNYSETPIEMEVKVGESPERFAFVLQRVAPGALTPHQARQQAEERAERAEQHAAQVRAECEQLQRETRGLNPHAMAGRRDAVARVLAALDAAGQPYTAGGEQPQHAVRGTNAEDCPACRRAPEPPPYPFLCPGPDGGPSR